MSVFLLSLDLRGGSLPEAPRDGQRPNDGCAATVFVAMDIAKIEKAPAKPTHYGAMQHVEQTLHGCGW